MFDLDCRVKIDCVGIGLFASVVIGIIAAVLRFTAVITVTPAFLWVAFGIAVFFLAATLLSSLLSRRVGTAGCVCRILPALLGGILVTVLTSVLLLGVEFAATSVLGAIITGILLAALSLIFILTACLAKCFVGCENCNQ